LTGYPYASPRARRTRLGARLPSSLSPWPESAYAFEATWSPLAERAHLVAVDLPGFGHSKRRDPLMSSRAMGEFVLRAADAFGLERPHVVGSGVGSSTVLFAAAVGPGRLRSLVVGSRGAAVPLQVSGPLKEWIEAPDVEPYRRWEDAADEYAPLVTGWWDRGHETAGRRSDRWSHPWFGGGV
jgi:pimeloyl-ACP methyl ester carboxylesterase